jgi:TolB protein
MFQQVRWVIVLLVLVLAACGGGGDAGSAGEGVAQTEGQPESGADNGNTPDNTQAPEGGLPGRLLFAQDGTLWLWQGTEPRPLPIEGQAQHPAWAPDGSSIAYIERSESYSELLLADSTGAPLRQLTSNGTTFAPHSRERIYDSMWAFYPTWAPDGSHIAVAGQTAPPVGAPAVEYNLSIFTVPVVGGNREQLYAANNIHVGQMAYAPNESAIVYTSSSSVRDDQQQLYRLLLGSRSAAPFPGAPLRSYDPAFSPDGRWLAFAARDDGRTDLWVLPGNPLADTAPTPLRLTNVGTARAPAFSPDGQMLAFLAIPPDEQGFELWVSRLELREDGVLRADPPRQMTSEMRLDADSGLSWAP